jgi:hypothetical protein
LEPALVRLSGGGAEVHGINNNAQSVGWSFDSDNPSLPCRRRATYWETPIAAPVNLGSLLATHVESRAVAINNAGLPQVVGKNLTVDLAMLWEEQLNGSWAVLDLNSSEAIGDCGSTRWTILDAHDINDDGWIVAIGSYTGSPAVTQGLYAVLLTPVQGGCPADVTNDGCINVSDLLAVINGWNSTCNAGGAICAIADTNCDYIVNITDLLAVINNWCTEMESACCSGCTTIEEPPSMLFGGSENPILELAIELVLESAHSTEVQADIIQQLLLQY